jgi:hypothetical protein
VSDVQENQSLHNQKDVPPPPPSCTSGSIGRFQLGQ